MLEKQRPRPWVNLFLTSIVTKRLSSITEVEVQNTGDARRIQKISRDKIFLSKSISRCLCSDQIPLFYESHTLWYRFWFNVNKFLYMKLCIVRHYTIS
jgi:hypothetical protein